MEITVTACTKVKEWNGKPIYSVELSDGTKGNSFGSEIPVGTAKTALKITPKEGYPDDIKLMKNGFVGRSAMSKGNESFALSYAKDIQVAHIMMGKEFKTENMLTVADKLFDWLDQKKR